MSGVRNILLIGRTGNGKSALANVISGTNKFREIEDSVSETKELELETFEYQGIKYRVIDTVGIGDTKLKSKDVLNRVAKACYEVREGLNQIFFVIGGRITEEELETYNLLKQIIFNEDIYSYTTIVRTRFTDFEDERRCEEDKEKISQENEKLAELIRICNKLIHVDNPPVKGRSAATNKEIREVSRERLLKHLIYDCGNYRPISLDRLNERISSYLTEKEQIKKELEDLKKFQAEEQIKTEAEKKRYEEEKRKSEQRLAEMEAKIEVQTKKALQLEQRLVPFNRFNGCRMS
ncbi:AIG1 family-domain-containing protein [Rhizophagus diaphanus]|nr:AIG1 family-domain-containing protein [Rhizophagus diaphanus] [Rhizophagus sp. MUCL 43196]